MVPAGKQGILSSLAEIIFQAVTEETAVGLSLSALQSSYGDGR